MNFKKKVSGSWVDAPYYLKGTDTETIATLPATIYPLAQTATIGLKGNTVQNGTPTPSTPVPVVGVGDDDNGNYKIPISSASSTTPVYLGEVQTTRRVRKWVLKGDEDGWFYSSGFVYNQNITPDYLRSSAITLICSHYRAIGGVAGGGEVSNGQCALYRFASVQRLYIRDNNYTTADDFKTYLAQQYAAGTPVTVWYVLAEPTTGIVNEPLMKIGNYADTISGISIPTIAGANTLDVDTTVKPSEVSAAFSGWHPVTSAHERNNGTWT